MRVGWNIDIHDDENAWVGSIIALFHIISTHLDAFWNCCRYIGSPCFELESRIQSWKGLFANVGFVRLFFKITLGVRPVHRVKASISTFYPLLLPSSRYLGQSNKEPTHFLPLRKRCSHNYWDLNWQKQLQKVWKLQARHVKVGNKISLIWDLILWFFLWMCTPKSKYSFVQYLRFKNLYTYSYTPKKLMYHLFSKS